MFVSHLPEFLARMDPSAMAHTLGEAAVGCVRQQMLQGYPTPVYYTGALMKDVSFAVDGPTVTIGNTLPYAGPVHDGTTRIPARPYLADGILAGASVLRDTLLSTLV